jgi:hypothetical protein
LDLSRTEWRFLIEVPSPGRLPRGRTAGPIPLVECLVMDGKRTRPVAVQPPAISPKGLPSESLQMAKPSRVWTTVPPSSTTR